MLCQRSVRGLYTSHSEWIANKLPPPIANKYAFAPWRISKFVKFAPNISFGPQQIFVISRKVSANAEIYPHLHLPDIKDLWLSLSCPIGGEGSSLLRHQVVAHCLQLPIIV